jgi:hypothetical protein
LTGQVEIVHQDGMAALKRLPYPVVKGFLDGKGMAGAKDVDEVLHGQEDAAVSMMELAEQGGFSHTALGMDDENAGQRKRVKQPVEELLLGRTERRRHGILPSVTRWLG